MTEVIAVRIPKELKDELEKLKIDYADEVRSMLEAIVKRKKLKKAMKEMIEYRNKVGKKTGITSSSWEIIREDRDHGH